MSDSRGGGSVKFGRVGGLVAVAVSAVVLAGCTTNSSAATSSSFCGYVMGNGENVNGSAQSRDIKQVLRPGETRGYDSQYDTARFFPCGPRNFRVTPGGDRNDALSARTKSVGNQPGTEVDVWVTAYWTPNQGDPALNEFITFCEKYQCATGDPNANQGQNFSSPGWNGMLAENMGPTLQRVAERAFVNIDDSVWKTNDQEQKDRAAGLMEEAFSAEFAKTSGFTSNIICGSGSGGPPNAFDCQNIRIVVDVVYAKGGLQQQATDSQVREAARQARDAQSAADIASTNGLYGPSLGEKFRFCRDLGDKCRVVVTDSGEVKVSVG